jgi:hypothetical protein
MMNIPPSEAKQLSLPDYESILYYWNESHSSGDGGEAPDPAIVMPMIDRINADPRHTGATVN